MLVSLMKRSAKPTRAQPARKMSTRAHAAKKVAKPQHQSRRAMATVRMPRRKYIDMVSDELLEATSKAGSDPYAPYLFHNTFKQASIHLPQFDEVIKHPFTSDEQKTRLVKNVLGHLKADEPTVSLYTRLAHDSKLGLAKDILGKYVKKAAAKNKDYHADVVSASPLSAPQLDTIKKSLAPYVPQGFKLVVFPTVEPSLGAGFTVQMENFYQDLSLTSAVRLAEQQIEEATSVV